MEKRKCGKLFCLVEEKKSRKIENIVYINWLICPCYIINKKYIYFYSLNDIKICITHKFLLFFFIITYNINFIGNKNCIVLTLLGRKTWATKFWIYKFNKLYILGRKDLVKIVGNIIILDRKLILLSQRF